MSAMAAYGTSSRRNQLLSLLPTYITYATSPATYDSGEEFRRNLRATLVELRALAELFRDPIANPDSVPTNAEQQVWLVKVGESRARLFDLRKALAKFVADESNELAGLADHPLTARPRDGRRIEELLASNLAPRQCEVV